MIAVIAEIWWNHFELKKHWKTKLMFNNNKRKFISEHDKLYWKRYHDKDGNGRQKSPLKIALVKMLMVFCFSV